MFFSVALRSIKNNRNVLKYNGRAAEGAEEAQNFQRHHQSKRLTLLKLGKHLTFHDHMHEIPHGYYRGIKPMSLN